MDVIAKNYTIIKVRHISLLCDAITDTLALTQHFSSDN